MGCSFEGFCLFAPISWINEKYGPVGLSQVLRITDFLVNRWGAVTIGGLHHVLDARHRIDKQDTANQCDLLQSGGHLIRDESEYVCLAHNRYKLISECMIRVFL